MTEEFKNHFMNTFKEEKMTRPKLDNLDFKTLSVEDNMGLKEIFTREEIREVIF